MENKFSNAAIGLFVLILGSTFIACVLWLASGTLFQKKVDLYMAVEDESVAGLNLNAPVKYNGVDVGKVQEIELDHDNPQRVLLKFAIDHGTPVKQDTEAVLKTQGLTGIAYVELSGGSQASPPLTAVAPNKYPVIRTKPSLSARLENVITAVLTNVDRTSASINAVLSDENRAAFKSILADLATTAHVLAARKDTIDAGIASAARTFDNSARVSAQLGPAIDHVSRSADSVGSMADEAKRASTNADKTITSVGTDVNRFTAETAPELQRLLGEMNVLAASLRRLSDKVEASPGGLLLGRRPVPPGPGEGKAP
jgi:phospholipid/cholesterol/gamma-HCH transport system substrate-binding protein